MLFNRREDDSKYETKIKKQKRECERLGKKY